MFAWLWRKWHRNEVVKNLLGVKVTLTVIDGQWYALARAWDRGHTDSQNRIVPERVAIGGVDASDALKNARNFLLTIPEKRSGDFFLARVSSSEMARFPGSLSNDGIIRNVFIFPDGMCAVFSAQGAQLTRYQGFWDDVRGRLMHDAPEDTEFVADFAPAVKELRAAGRGWKVESRTHMPVNEL